QYSVIKDCNASIIAGFEWSLPPSMRTSILPLLSRIAVVGIAPSKKVDGISELGTYNGISNLCFFINLEAPVILLSTSTMTNATSLLSLNLLYNVCMDGISSIHGGHQ